MTEGLPLTDELATVFARMSGVLLSQESVSSALALVVSLARDTVPGASGCGVSLMNEQGRRTTAAATDARVEQADALQYELNQGPCLSAWAQREVVRVEDMASERRWERWCAAANELGLRSTLSAPMLVGGGALGAIKVYGEQPGAFHGGAEDLLVRFAAQAAVLLANAQAFESAQELSEGLKTALRSRDVIATAKGILMGRDGLGEDTAFSMLVSASQRQNTKLRDVAEAIVSATSRRQR
ncbi:MAG: GAF and ANTAR domain-containing protein [Actinobacteria bacterium]|nr:GAF and ANTAR domain-containing protein [Actinomycetota bacterium]